MLDLRLGFQPGYSPWCSTSKEPRKKAASTRSAMAWSSETTELRWLVMTLRVSPSICAAARFEDVSTRPGMSGDIFSTPWGHARRVAMILAASPSSMGFSVAEAGSAVALTPESEVANSASRSFEKASASAIISSASSPGTAMMASASRQIALGLLPPSRPINWKSYWSSVKRKRTRRRRALALSLLMSSPLWPPWAPETRILRVL